MATIVNNPSGGDGSGAGGWIVAIVVIIILVLLALFLFPSVFNNANEDAEVTQPAVENEPSPIINNTFNSTTTVISPTTTEE